MSAAIAVARGSSSCSKPSRFASNAVVKKLTPVALPPGRLTLATRPRVTGSTPAKNTIGIVEVAAFAAIAGGVFPTIHGHLPLQKLGDQSRQPVVLAAGPSIFNGHVLTLDETDFLQPLAERGHIGHWCAGCITRPDEADEWDGLLRARRERPRRRAPEQRDERAPLHSITSSARASTVAGTSRPKALALLRLITISNLVGCSTGKSAGVAPFKILTTYAAATSRASLHLLLTQLIGQVSGLSDRERHDG